MAVPCVFSENHQRCNHVLEVLPSIKQRCTPTWSWESHIKFRYVIPRKSKTPLHGVRLVCLEFEKMRIRLRHGLTHPYRV